MTLHPELSALGSELTSLYREHAPALLTYAGSIAKNRDIASDAVQEVFLRYFVQRKYGVPIENPRAWLYRVLFHHVLDKLKAAATKREITGDTPVDIADLRSDPETKVQRIQTASEIASRLTPRELDCLRLRAEGFSYNEIAVALGVRPGTVSALLPRVYSKLREAAAQGVGLPAGISEILANLFSGDKAYSS